MKKLLDEWQRAAGCRDYGKAEIVRSEWSSSHRETVRSSDSTAQRVAQGTSLAREVGVGEAGRPLMSESAACRRSPLEGNVNLASVVTLSFLEARPLEFAKALECVTAFLEERKVRYGIVGAVGLHAYGLTRATADLDFVVEERGRPDLIRFLESLGYESVHVSEGYSNHVHPLGSRGRIDFVYVDEKTAEILFEDARSLDVLPGRKALVPRPEHLAAMKVLAMKNDPARTFQEMSDIRYLLTLPGVDAQKIRDYFVKHGLESRFDEIQKTITTG
jgi:hypothetical protein